MVEPIGHVCASCDEVLLELVEIVNSEMEGEIAELEAANTNVQAVLDVFREFGWAA